MGIEHLLQPRGARAGGAPDEEELGLREADQGLMLDEPGGHEGRPSFSRKRNKKLSPVCIRYFIVQTGGNSQEFFGSFVKEEHSCCPIQRNVTTNI
jgi:hypothetical protein